MRMKEIPKCRNYSCAFTKGLFHQVHSPSNFQNFQNTPQERSEVESPLSIARWVQARFLCNT